MRWLMVILASALLWSSAGQVLSAQPDATVARGERLFQANCAMCHGADASGMMGMHPALTGAVRRLSAEGVEVAIRNGRDTMPPMPAFADRLSSAEIDALVAYVGALPDGPRNFGPEGRGGGMGGGMGGMGGRMLGGAMLILVALLFAALAGAVGYLFATRRRER